MHFNSEIILILFLLFKNINWVSTNIIDTTLMDTTNTRSLHQVETINLAAVGRVAQLGDLYDARTDKFIPISLMKSEIPNSSIKTINNPQTKSTYTLANSLEEKFTTMGISAELKISIMGGLFELEGSGKFFKDKKKSAKSAKATLISSVFTVVDQLSIMRSEVANQINQQILETIDATHVVVGIQYGGNFFMSVEDLNKQDSDQMVIEGKLGAKLEMFAVSISGSASVNFNETVRNEINSFKFEIYADIVLKSNPQTVIEALEVMKNAPQMLLESNKGKGKQIKYTLLSIGLLRQIFRIKGQINSLSNRVDTKIVDSCTKLYDDINKVEQKINDLVEAVKRFDRNLSSKKTKEVIELHQSFKEFQSAITNKLSTLLISVRSGEQNSIAINQFLSDAFKSPYALGNIDLDRFLSLQKEMRFLNYLVNLNSTLLSKDISLREYLSLNFNKDIYIFFFKNEFPDLTDSAMLNYRKILEKRKTLGPSSIMISVKYDVLSEQEQQTYFNFNTSTKLSMFKNGRLIIKDYSIDTNVTTDTEPELWSFHYMQKLLAKIQNMTMITKSETKKLRNNFKLLDEVLNDCSLSKSWKTCQLFKDEQNRSKLLAIPKNKNELSGTWQEADQVCKKHHANSIAIESKLKQNIIEEFLQKFNISKVDYWTCGKRKANVFYWMSNGHTFNYTKWAPGDPNNHQKKEDCVHIYANTFEWNDRFCGRNYSIICEINIEFE